MTELEPYDVAAYWDEIRQCLKEIEEHPRAHDDEAFAYFLMNVTSNLIQLYDQLVQIDQMISTILDSVRDARDSLYKESESEEDGTS